MTEREFDQKVERAAANFERWVETAADVALQTSCEKFSYNLQKRNGA